MKIAFFDAHHYDRKSFEAQNQTIQHDITFLEPRLTHNTAMLAKGHTAVCSFVNDTVDKETLQILKECSVKLVALRSAGYNHVDLKAAAELGIKIVRVPEYSPFAVAEHSVALLLALNRKIFRAYNRVRDWNFSLDGLVGFDLHGKTVGIIGTGRIGKVAARIFRGFGCHIIAHDVKPDQELVFELGVEYLPLQTLYSTSDILCLYVPLTPETHHLINAEALSAMKKGAILINTSRGALIDSPALIEVLKTGQLGAAGLDVYEEEEGVFFQDLSNRVLQDDVLARLLTFPNVIVTSHQAFLTQEALQNIAQTTLQNISDFENAKPLLNEVHIDQVQPAPRLNR
ncbi:MAG: 2-hydroxyacid dehydrogenase [Myxococcales bacterium]|nr:MAG: 2-hydroxyacid dehydrogenase [Myxococcales bacterium]